MQLRLSLPRDAKLRKWLRVPALIFDCIHMQSKFITVDAVDEVAEGTPNPVRCISKAGSLLHDTSTSAHTGLLVDGLDLSGVEHECLCRLSAKDEHISVVKLDASDRLSSD